MQNKKVSDEQIVRSLEHWLVETVSGVRDLTITHFHRSKSAGWSAETILFDAQWRRGGEPELRTLVLRRQIRGLDLLHDADLRFQWETMKVLHAHPDLHVPTPGVIGIEETGDLLGAPFLVMERLPGRILPQHPNYNISGWLHDMSVTQRRQTWSNGIEAMASVNRLPWSSSFAVLARGKTPGLAGYIEFIADWYRWAVAGRQFALGDRAVAYLREKMPKDPALNVVWGDPTSANTLFDNNGYVTGLIDWEFAGSGPGELDLAWWMLFDELYSEGMRVPRLNGLPDAKDTIAIYERALGREVRDLHYYEVVAWLRMALVSMRAVDRQVALGNFRADNNAWSNNASAAGLGKRLGHDVEVGQDFFDFVQQLTGGD